MSTMGTTTVHGLTASQIQAVSEAEAAEAAKTAAKAAEDVPDMTDDEAQALRLEVDALRRTTGLRLWPFRNEGGSGVAFTDPDENTEDPIHIGLAAGMDISSLDRTLLAKITDAVDDAWYAGVGLGMVRWSQVPAGSDVWVLAASNGLAGLLMNGGVRREDVIDRGMVQRSATVRLDKEGMSQVTISDDGQGGWKVELTEDDEVRGKTGSWQTFINFMAAIDRTLEIINERKARQE